MRRLGVLALVALVASDAGARSGHCRGRGGQRDCGDSGGFFEFAPVSGVGMPPACSATAPTGAKGEPAGFARSTTATCSLQGGADAGIADGSLSTLAANTPRIEPDDEGVLAFFNEDARTNSLLRFIAINNAAWSDVGTPALTAGQTSPWTGTYATSAVTITDDSAAAFEGRSQSVTVSAGVAYWMHCYVKAGTATTARISIDGTTQDIAGLSSSTWTIVEKGDASASGAAITAQVLVGNSVAVTGSVTWGGCQVEAGTSRSSIIPTDGVAVPRAAESGLTFDLGADAPAANLFSFSAHVTHGWSTTTGGYPTVFAASTVSLSDNSGKGFWFYSAGGFGSNFQCLSGNNAGTLYQTATLAPDSTAVRCASSGTGTIGSYGVNAGSVAISGAFSPARYVTIGALAGSSPFAGSPFNGRISRVVYDASPTRASGAPVAWIGDSISSGFGSPGFVPVAILAQQINRSTFNAAVPSYTAAQCLSQWTNLVKGRGYKTVILLCGVNSIVLPQSAATIYATLSTIITEAQSEGARVIVLGLTPWATASTWTAPFQVVTDDLNALLAAAPGVTYVSTNSLGSGSPLALTTYDSGDGIHPNAAGSTVLAALAAGANP